MALSLFLAKLFGVYLLIVAGLWIVRGDEISKSLAELFASRAMLFMSGLLALAVGIAMAISHSIWEFNWRGLISLFGYVSIAKGIARVAFPAVSQRAVGALLRGTRQWIWVATVAALGVYLCWAGFTQN